MNRELNVVKSDGGGRRSLCDTRPPTADLTLLVPKFIKKIWDQIVTI